MTVTLVFTHRMPADIAGDETTFATSLRALEHRDAYGNVIGMQ